MAKKKRPMTDAERMAAMRARNAEAGKAQVTVTLSVKTINKLDRLAKRDDVTRSELVSRLIKSVK